MIKSPLYRADVNPNKIISSFKIRDDYVSLTNSNYINIGDSLIPTTLLGFLYFYIKHISSVTFNELSMILPDEKYEFRIAKVELEDNMIDLHLRSLANLHQRKIKINYDNIEEIKIKNDDKIAIKINLNNN